MSSFKKISNQIETLGDVNCGFEIHTTESILKISLDGACGIGSQGENYGTYIYQSIGLALLIHQPIGIIIDLRDLTYEYGDRILSLFQVFSDVRPMGDDTINAYVLSDKNKYGLSALLHLNLDELKPPFFDDYQTTFDHVFKLYNAI